MKKTLSFYLEHRDWLCGVADKFSFTPLGEAVNPLPIEEIGSVEWTIIKETFVSVSLIDPAIQIKFWMHLPENVRDKILRYSQLTVPFSGGRLQDRYLIAYTIETLTNKYFGFLFESMLSESKAGLYVFIQTDITDEELNPAKFLQEYLKKMKNLSLDRLKGDKKSRFAKLLAIFNR